MNDTTVKRVIEVDVKASANAAAHIKQIADGMGGLEKTAAQTKGAMTQFFDTVGTAAKGFIGFFIANKAWEAVMFLNQLSDSGKVLHERMKLVTGTTELAADAFREITRVSIEQGRELDSTAKLYEKVARNADALGIATRGVSMVTEGFAASLRLSGATTQEANAAMTQFAQALASGRLQGDEFRSIMENNSVFMFELSKAAGVSMAALREMSKNGKTDAEFLREAMFKLGEDGKNVLQRMIEKAEELPKTYDQAKEGVKTALTDLISALGVTADNAEGIFTRMLKSVQKSMTGAARAVREEAEIQGAIAKALGNDLPKPTGKDLMDEDAKRNVLLFDRQQLERSSMAVAETKRKHLIAAGLAEDAAAIKQIDQNVARMKATIDTIDKILEREGHRREQRANGPLLIEGWKPAVKEEKHKGFEFKEDPIEALLGKYRDAESAAEEKIEGMGKHMRQAWRAIEDSLLDTSRGWGEQARKALLESANKLDSREAAQRVTEFISKRFAEGVKAAAEQGQKDLDQYVSRLNHYKKAAMRLNPLHDIEQEVDEVKRLIADPATTENNAKILQQYLDDLRLKMAERLLGPKDSVKGVAEQVADAWGDSFSRMTDNLLDFSRSSKEILADFVVDFLREWAKIEMKQAMAPLMEAGKKWVKDTLGTVFGSADGSAFTYGGVRMFANGGVVNGPTPFGMAGGGMGVAGEAGPEAIMPLRRGADGKLGVGSTPVTVNIINNSGAKTKVEETTDPNGGRQISVMIDDAVERGLGGGRFDKVMQQSFGVGRKGR
jgi:tape measure domain-containing protein